MSEFAQRLNRTHYNHLISLAKPEQTMRRPVHAENPLLAGQQSLGNQAVQRLLRTGVIQAELTINEPGDPYEQEADRIADEVMRMPDPGITKVAAVPGQVRGARIQRACSECEEELHRQPMGEGAEGNLHAGAVSRTSEVNPNVQAEIDDLRGRGQPLPQSVQAFFEPRLGHDFSLVRIHTNARAAESARAINARAYTIGRDVMFGAGQYAPGTAEGKKLLAHELTHTVQQTGAGGATGDGPAHLQRTIGDGHDLTAPRFAGDGVLEAVYDDERLLRVGDRGPAVEKLQQAIMDAGFPLPRFGADGIFGAETKTAIEGFQRASGLTGAGVDGIVGPITMGWLDQRFSAGPTPAGAAPGSTPGCAAIKTVNVDLVSLHDSSRNAVADLEVPNTVFDQCCVRFALRQGTSAAPAQSNAWLGGDTDLDNKSPCGSPTAEETALSSGATTSFGLSSRVRVFYVASLGSGDRAYSIPPFCSTGAAAGLRNMAAVSNSGAPRSLAHEFGHILLNSGDHPVDTNNLMNPTNTATGDQLTPAQCATVFANA